MKILLHHRIRSKDGQFVHLEEMSRAFQRLGHEVVLVGPAAMHHEEFGAEAGWIDALKKRLPAFLYELLEFGYSLPAFLRLWRAVRKHRPDVLYERYSLFFPPGVWVHRLTNLPMLLEVNSPLLVERTRYGGLSLQALARWSEEYAWRGADFVLPVTEVLAGYVRKAGVPDDRVVVIPNGVDLARFQDQPDREECKRRLGLQGKLVVGFTGFVREWHGLERVVDWIADHPGSPPRHLLITGDGPARPLLEERARERGVSGSMTITGIVARDNVSRYVAAYDIALQPAVVEYASPLKLFEYLALGCAIVAPSAPNIREILTDNESAVLFNPEDPASFGRAVERVCDDAILRNRISEGARRTIAGRQLTWDHNAGRVIRLFEQLGVRNAAATIKTEAGPAVPHSPKN